VMVEAPDEGEAGRYTEDILAVVGEELGRA
jgi:hypothetical protein